MSSRIFIKNLPPSKFTENDFKAHFEKFAPITDVKLFPARRIGYIGFKSVEDAQRAVKYFNKTFVRMSRIAVEISRPVADESLPRPWSAHTPGSSAYQRRHEQKTPTPLKRKRDEEEGLDPALNPKLQQFLEVMHPSKGKTWSNGENIAPEEGSVTIVQADEGESDNEYVEIQSKPKKAEDVFKNTSQVNTIITKNTDTEMAHDSTEPGIQLQGADIGVSEVGNRLMTDDEWLRSKTSRVLDLTDNIEAHLAQLTTENSSLPPTKQRSTNTTLTEPEDEPEAFDKEKQEEIEEPSNEGDAFVEGINKTGRLFLRNLPYTATEEELWQAFEPFGELEEAHLVLDNKTNESKGFAFVLFKNPADAVVAYKAMDKRIFQGRLIHIIPGAAKRENKLDEFAIAKLPLKKQLEFKKKATAGQSFNWNSMYMNVDAVMSSIADRLGVSKSELLDPTSTDAAVKQAHAETHIIQETKSYFKEIGVNLEAFGKNPKYKQKDDRVILIKNFPYGTTKEELIKILGEFGQLGRFFMPPAGTIAIAEFIQAPAARAAYTSLAYRRFKNAVLFLEKAPQGLFDPDFDPKTTTALPSQPTSAASIAKVPKISAQDLLQAAPVEDNSEEVDTTTLYVRNLNFSTTSADLTRVFSSIPGFRKAIVKQKPDPKKPGSTLSMGFGFVEFSGKAQAHAAMAAMNGHTLDGHQLLVKASHKAVDAAAERRREDLAKKVQANKTKIILKNLPFEASEKDIRRLVGPYGKLKAVRLPKKFGSRSSGFAFAEFISAKEALMAMETLKDTHFLGRKLVIEWSSQDAVSAEEEIEKMQMKVGKQSRMMGEQALRETNKRRKFVVGGGEEE